MARFVVMLAVLVFLLGFGFLTAYVLVRYGVTSFGVFSALVLLLVAIPVIGALWPRRR